MLCLAVGAEDVVELVVEAVLEDVELEVDPELVEDVLCVCTLSTTKAVVVCCVLVGDVVSCTGAAGAVGAVVVLVIVTA